MRALLAGLMLFASASLAQADATRAVLHTATGAHPFTIELVDTAETRAKGLMYRKELAPDAGMLFDFQTERQTSFWMQNTLIPLDMLFIGADGVIKTIHANAVPLDTTPIPSNAAVRFVLEIPGGRAAEIGAKPGDRLEHDLVE
jgi:uncharacterized membrane protein (UPF0127 family)